MFNVSSFYHYLGSVLKCHISIGLWNHERWFLTIEDGRHVSRRGWLLSLPSARNGGGERLDMMAGEMPLLRPFFWRGGNGTRAASLFEWIGRRCNFFLLFLEISISRRVDFNLFSSPSSSEAAMQSWADVVDAWLLSSEQVPAVVELRDGSK